jgi:protein-S-isoprenylcysteine O-methyltransferase Ste14
VSEQRDSAGVIAPPPLLALAAIVLGLAIDHWLPLDALAALLSWPVRVIVGVLLFAGSAALGVPALLAFRAAGTHVEPWKPATVLVTGGIFRRLRNPMYVAIVLFLLGLAILLASDGMLLTTLVLVPVLHLGVVRREERYLEVKFGDAYRRYRDTVPRYGWPR